MKALRNLLILLTVSITVHLSAQMECLNVLPDTTKNNCELMLADQCDPQFLGLVMLYEESIEYANVFCDSLDHRITFINDKQEEVYLNVTSFRHEILSAMYNMRNVCKDDWSESSSYCLDREVITIAFTITGYSEQFFYTIEPRPQINHPAPDRIGDYLEISYIYGEPTSRFSTTNFIELIVIVNQGTQTYGARSKQINKRRMNLLGEKFEHVTTMIKNESKRKRFQFFLSKREGIAGFIDKEGVLWRVKYRPDPVRD